MRHPHLFLGLLLGLLASVSLSCWSAAPPRETDSEMVKKLFAAPPREYATAPLWVWNDQLTEAQVVGKLRDLAAQAVKQVFVHPRPGS